MDICGLELRARPVAGGALVTLVLGTGGIAAPSVALNLWGPVLGAVAGGATAALLSNRDPVTDVASAIAADLCSSIAFFALVLVVYLVTVHVEEGLAYISGAVVSFWYLVFGGMVAVPVAAVSLCVAALGGAVASLANHRLRSGSKGGDAATE